MPPGGQHDLPHVVDVANGDHVFQVIERPDRDGQGEDHGEAGIDRAGDEVGREDGRVPARELRHRKIEADDRMHREHQRRGQARRAAARRSRSASSGAPNRASRARAVRRNTARTPTSRDRAECRDRGSCRCTRRRPRWSRRSRPRRRPTAAGNGTAARRSSSSDRARASTPAMDARCG